VYCLLSEKYSLRKKSKKIVFLIAEKIGKTRIMFMGACWGCLFMGACFWVRLGEEKNRKSYCWAGVYDL